MASPTNTDTPYLRSINLVYDADYPERVNHFQPTAKCVALLPKLAGLAEDRAFFVIAPYGSGKSLTATYLLHLVENRPAARSILSTIRTRLLSGSPELNDFVSQRAKQQTRQGIVLTLEGHQSDIAVAMKEAALKALYRAKMGREAASVSSLRPKGTRGAIHVLEVLRRKAETARRDRVVILWDEFGRHLERLAATGNSAALAEIQQLAEYVTRAKKLPMTLSVIMHQGLLQYAGALSQSALAEWRKVGGRFRAVQYVDDSNELYGLIASLVASKRAFAPADEPFAANAAELRTRGIFTAIPTGKLAALLASAYPLDPIAFYLLPRLAARAAQNERTLFGFLYRTDLSSRVSPADLYDYFAPVMQADTSVGGTYRRWLETESALSKAKNSAEISALKTATLLGLGIAGERTNVSKELLQFALSFDSNPTHAQHTIRDLISRKLLLHRKHINQIALWHGTDVDLRGRLREEKERQGQSFNLERVLTSDFPPPVWRPTRYNDEYCLRRYFSGRYFTVPQLHGYLTGELIIRGLPSDIDGIVIYVLVNAADELTAAENLVRNYRSDPRLVFALPREPLKLADAISEIACLNHIQGDDSLLGKDPLVAVELQQMLDDSQLHARRLVDQLVQPRLNGPRWFHNGNELSISSPATLRAVLSDIAESIFPGTPRINNEMIVRHKPSAIVINARKKVVLGILERHGTEKLGIEGEFADASIFRTVLLNTGLYRPRPDGTWYFAQPEEVDDAGLRQVWERFHELLTMPSRTPKDLVRFFDELQQPPLGLRRGLFPILFSAALKAFPSAISITRANGENISDLLPSEIEAICRAPTDYRLMVVALRKEEKAYLEGIQRLFSAQETPSSSGDVLQECMDAIEEWKAQAPPGALTSRFVSQSAQRLQSVLLRRVDPVELLFTELPKVVGEETSSPQGSLSHLVSAKKELDDVAATYYERAEGAVRRVLGHTPDERRRPLREAVSDWANCFPPEFVQSIEDGVSRAVLGRLGVAYRTDALLIDSLASLLIGKRPSRWDDSVVPAFERELQAIVARVETAVLDSGEAESSGQAASQLGKLVQRRIAELATRLSELIGEEAAHQLLSDTIKGNRASEKENGNATRSLGNRRR